MFLTQSVETSIYNTSWFVCVSFNNRVSDSVCYFMCRIDGSTFYSLLLPWQLLPSRYFFPYPLFYHYIGKEKDVETEGSSSDSLHQPLWITLHWKPRVHDVIAVKTLDQTVVFEYVYNI